MGLMASHLQDRIDCKDLALVKPIEATIRAIQDVTTYDRNPLTHKELVLNEDDAALLFNRAQGMIFLMAKELMDRVDELQPPLPLIDGLTAKGLKARAPMASKSKQQLGA